MKFTISKTELQTALGIAGKCVGTNKILPAHEDYLFSVSSGVLYVSATDGDRFITYHCNVDSDGDCKIQLPATTINDLVKATAEQPIIISVTDKVMFKTLSGEYDFPLEDGSNYPDPPHDEVFCTSLPSEVLISGIDRVSHAISADYTRPALTGLYIEMSKDNISFTATNGALLSTVSLHGEYDNGSSLITQKISSTIQSMPCDEIVKLSIGKSSIRFYPNDNTELHCVVLGERYVDYRSVLPSGYINKMEVSRTGLLAILNRIRIFGSKLENLLIVKLILGENVQVTADNHLSQSAKENVNCIYTGPEMTVMFNVNYLIACLSKIKTDEVTISFGADHRRAFTIEGKNEPGIMLVVPYGKS